ncbi:hypothetical protein BJX66DRAFT_320720 [Aspergillus keveii]|uniref:Uncharacterized protein n=1 Tax=Aspergillus keveii TaxID=714993 RepID=A0ABR4FH57_9EURO
MLNSCRITDFLRGLPYINTTVGCQRWLGLNTIFTAGNKLKIKKDHHGQPSDRCSGWRGAYLRSRPYCLHGEEGKKNQFLNPEIRPLAGGRKVL